MPSSPSSPFRWTWATLQLVRRDLKVRYKNSALGFFWSFLNPLMQIVILTVVFKYIMGSKIPNFSMELFTCYLPWMFFAQALNDGAACVGKDQLLIRKYAFPRIIIPISSLLSNLVHLALGLVVLFVIFLGLPVHINVHFLWLFPLLVIQCTFTLGLVLMLATLHMYYEDIRFILGSVTQLWFFLCPIVYSVDNVMGSTQLSTFWKGAYLVANPLTPLFVGYRTALLHGGVWPVPEYYTALCCSALWAVLALGIGTLLWRRYQWQFPELV